MIFGAVGFLFAALAAGIPVVLHMINRQKARDLPFSTLRFLRISVNKTRRRRRIQDALLMIVRMAVLMLIAFGLAQPTVTSLRDLFGDARSAVVIVLDNSASMDLTDAGRPRFETAADAARQIVDHLEDDDEVALLVTNGPDLGQPDKPDRNPEDVHLVLDQIRVSAERADLTEAMVRAKTLLEKSNAANKQIWLLSDLQEHSLASLQAAMQKPKKSQDENADAEGEEQEDTEKEPSAVIVVDCHRQPKANVAVTGVTLKSQIPVAGLPITCTVELTNASTVPRKCHLELLIDGPESHKQSSPVILVPPSGRETYSFQHAFGRAGHYRCEARLVDEDGSILDNRRFFAIEIDPGIRVALVKQRRHEVARLDDTFYIEQSLLPGDDGESVLVPTVLTAADLETEPLGYKVIFCVNLKPLSAPSAERLRQYVQDGGNVVWICGDNVDPAGYNQMNETAGGSLLPAKLLQLHQAGKGENAGIDAWEVDYIDGAHPALTGLDDPESLYRSILVQQYVAVQQPGDNAAGVLARLDNDAPLLLQRKFTTGSTTLLTTSAGDRWTNLARRPIFAPLLVKLAHDLAGTKMSRRDLPAGDPLVLALAGETAERKIRIKPPQGQELDFSTVADPAGGQIFAYADTHQTGIYRLSSQQTTPSLNVAYSINVDPQEADQRKTDREELQAWFGDIPVVFAEDPDDLTSTFKLLDEGESLWVLFLSLVLVALVFETFLSNWFSPKQVDEDEMDVPPGMRRLARKGRGAA
ncbi:MAG: BatA domain-containing protein [Planctomycetes bacterium]|nr:BatA domain-containing protein [Planctomycetota bacterium]